MTCDFCKCELNKKQYSRHCKSKKHLNNTK